jgi:hypothetical protein
MKISPLAGQLAPAAMRVDVAKLVSAYYAEAPDPAIPAQRVAFGTSGHRGSSFQKSFNEAHVLAITQAICRHRAQHAIDGPLFLGIDTHALSAPACASALEVLAANGIDVMLAQGDELTPTPATIAGAPPAWPTASSSRRRTIRRRTAGSSTTRRTAGRRTPGSPAGSRRRPTSSWSRACGACSEFRTSGRSAPRRRIATTISTPTSTTSAR